MANFAILHNICQLGYYFGLYTDAVAASDAVIEKNVYVYSSATCSHKCNTTNNLPCPILPRLNTYLFYFASVRTKVKAKPDPKEKERKCSVCKEQAQRNVRFKVKPTEWGCSQAYGGTPYEESFQQFMKPLDKTQSRSMLELCIQLAKLPEAQAGPVVSSAEATELCTCLGCCEAPRGKDACPFPVTVTDYDCPDCGK